MATNWNCGYSNAKCRKKYSIMSNHQVKKDDSLMLTRPNLAEGQVGCTIQGGGWDNAYKNLSKSEMA